MKQSAKKTVPPLPRVLLVDDEADVLEMLGDWLSNFGFTLRTALSAHDAVSLARAETFDVVITDLKMPGLDGLQLLSLLKELDPSIQVIFLTGQGTIDDAVAALRGGKAFDFLQKPLRDLNKLNRVIEQAYEVCKKTRSASSRALQPVPVVLEPLTQREVEIVSWLSYGLENGKIAARLNISDKTVKNHLSRIFDKLGVTNRTQAVLLCQQLNLIS